MSETKVGEPVLMDGLKVRKVRRNRKNYGEIRYHPDKVTVYWAKRRTDQFHRLTGSWLIDADTISAVKLYGVTHVGLEIEDGTKMLTRIGTFGPEGVEKGAQRARSNSYVDEWGNRGAMCWHIPTALWAVQEPPEKLKTEFMLAQMHIKRGRQRKSVLTMK